MPHPSKSGNGNGNNEKKGNSKRSRPSFQASFPAPRRAAPSLHGSDLSQPLLGGGKNGSGNSSGNGPTKGAGGIVYRSADSTQRTLNELAKRRHERMEKRRAAALLAALGFLALVVHFASREPPDPMAMKDASLRGSGGDGNGTMAAGSDIDWDMMNDNDDELDDGGERQYDEEPAVERVIDEDKMSYLGPLRYFEEVRDPPRRTDVPFFFHIPVPVDRPSRTLPASASTRCWRPRSASATVMGRTPPWPSSRLRVTATSTSIPPPPPV